MMNELFGCQLRDRSIVSWQREAAHYVHRIVDHIKQVLCAAPVVHCDETAIYVAGARRWLHVLGTANLLTADLGRSDATRRRAHNQMWRNHDLLRGWFLIGQKVKQQL